MLNFESEGHAERPVTSQDNEVSTIKPSTSVKSSTNYVKDYEDTRTIMSSNAGPIVPHSNRQEAGFPTQYRLASINQANGIFGVAAGKQCMPTCYFGIIENNLHHSVDQWSGSYIEELIASGTEMYNDYKPRNEDYFNVPDLPKELMYRNINVRCHNFHDVAGVITKNADPNNIAFMNENMQRFFENEDNMGVLVTMAGFTTAVLRGRESFNVLDTHARNAQGKPSDRGYAGVFHFGNLFSVCVYLVKLSQLLTNCEFVQYELCTFQVSIKSPVRRTLTSSSIVVTTPKTTNLSKTHNSLPSEPVSLDRSAVLTDKYDQIVNDDDCVIVTDSVNPCSLREPSEICAVTASGRGKRKLKSSDCTPDTKRSRYHTDPVYREKKKAASKKRYQLVKTDLLEKYHDDLDYRSGVLKSQSVSKNKKYQSDDFRMKAKKYQHQKYKTDENYRDQHKQYQHDRYCTDENYRDQHKQYQHDKYCTDENYRDQHKEMQAKYQHDRYCTDEDHKNKMLMLSKQKNIQRKEKRSELELAIEEFRIKSQKGPSYVCCSCHRLMFDNQVKIMKRDSYSDTVHTYIMDEYKHFSCTGDCEDSCAGKQYICHTCHNHFHSGEMPPQAVVNNLSVLKRESTFQCLNSLEQQLISLDLPFEKLITLPRTAQKKIQGPVTCVPSNVKTVTDCLPRPLGASKIIPVKLKRKLIYKSHVDFQVIDSVKLKNALVKLKQINPLYKDIAINDHWNEAPCVDDSLHNLIRNEQQFSETTDEDEVENDNDDPVDTIDGHIFNSCMQPVDVTCEISAEDINNLSIAPAEGNRPINILQEKFVEARAFPTLFPDSRNTFDSERFKKLTRSKYYDARIYSVDTRFAANTEYIFFAQYAKEYDQLLSSISISLRKGNNARHITPNMLLNQESLQTILKSDQGFRYFKSIRGSPEFWKQTMNDLFAMIRTLGIPTWFLTLSSAELSRWTCHLSAILTQQGIEHDEEYIRNLDYLEKCKIIKSNPVTAVRMFYHRVDLFFNLILRGPCNPIGKVRDFFYRVEFQARGAPHIHCLFWIEDAPKFDNSTDEEICRFIDRYVKAELPDIVENPELHELVSKLQTHSKNHSKSCKKGKKKCRFNYPKCISDKTFIARPGNFEHDSNIMEAKLKKLREFLESGEERDANHSVYTECGFEGFQQFQDAMKIVSKKANVVLRRSQTDIWVNNYNPDLLKAWQANLDLQFVLDPYACIMYIVSYISKNESELSEVLKKARDDMVRDGLNSNSRQVMRFLGQKYFTHREISVQEAIVRLCGMKLKQSSRQVIFLPTNEEDTRMSVPLSKIKSAGENDSTDIWMPSKHDKYSARPNDDDIFENMCQAQFAADYRLLAKTEVEKYKNSKNMYKLQGDQGYILKRTQSDPAVIRYTRFSKVSNPEKYYLSLLLLYLPHRRKAQLKTELFQTYEEFYTNAAVKIGDEPATKVKDIVTRNQVHFAAEDDDIDAACDLLQNTGPLEDAWSLVAPNIECDRQEQLIEQDEIAEIDDSVIEPIPGLNDEPITRGSLCSYELLTESVRPQLRSMNKKQQQIFYHIREWCKKRSIDSSTDPFNILITGGAGVGKSHLIKCIYNMCHKLLRNPQSPDDPSVVLLAPTGTAAHNISGFTIHSALKVPVMLGAKSEFIPLKPDTLNTVRCMVGTVQIIIIDEFSMVSPQLLQYVNCRLRQIKGFSQSDENAPFGRVSILAVGDFYQLSPVKSSSLILPTAASGHFLFVDHFRCVELTEVMRQRDDATFAHMLNRLRVKRKKDDMEPADYELLNSRVNCCDEPDDALHIYSRNVDVHVYNEEMLFKCDSQIYEIKARDYQKSKTSGKMTMVSTPKKDREDNVLAYMLKLTVNCRIMVTKNIDIAHGLVNGVFGSVVGFQMDNAKEQVDQVYVVFDGDNVGRGLTITLPADIPPRAIPISKIENPLSKNLHITRRQFPLKLGYAATAHKVQGMSLERLVYDMNHTFQPGQAYVALSRATSLDGLYLKSLLPDKIYMNESIHTHLSMLPELQLDQFSFEEVFLVCHNVQSVMNKLEDMKTTYVKRTKILCITETWLSENYDDTRVDIEGFKLYRTDRMDNSNRGGSAVYVSLKVQSEFINLIRSADIEATMCKITENGVSYLICCVYRPGTVNNVNSINYLRNCVTTAENIPAVSSIIFAGDFNENLLNTTSAHPIYELFLSMGYHQCVRESTHLLGSLLDAVYIKDMPTVTAVVRPIYFSDHETVEVIRQ